jgi:hypothetical protein
MDITWHKDSAGSYYATHDGKRIATARKDGNAWHGTVVGLGHGFTGRRLTDVKELAYRHVERIYGEGEWTLFPARDLKPGMVLGCDSWKDGEREVTSVSVDTDAQTVDVELSSESSRELGFTLGHTYAVGEYVRVRPLEVEIVRAEHLAEGDAVWFYEGKGIVTAVEPVGNNLGQLRVTTLFKGEYGTLTVYPGSTFERVRKVEEAEQAPQVSGGDVFKATATEPIRVEDVAPGMKLMTKDGTVTEVTSGAEILRDGWQKGKVRHCFRTLSDSPCTGGSVTLPMGTVLHRIVETDQTPQTHTLDNPADTQALAEWEADERDAVEAEGERFAPEALGMQTIDLHPFTAVVDAIAGTGVLISPPASEDVSLSDGGASLHDALLADALRRLLPLGIEALEGENGGLSLEGVTPDGRKVFSLYISDCITTEPNFEEVAMSIEALRQAAGL